MQMKVEDFTKVKYLGGTWFLVPGATGELSGEVVWRTIWRNRAERRNKKLQMTAYLRELFKSLRQNVSCGICHTNKHKKIWKMSKLRHSVYVDFNLKNLIFQISFREQIFILSSNRVHYRASWWSFWYVCLRSLIGANSYIFSFNHRKLEHSP